VYSFGITGVLSCFDAAGGKRLWQVDTLKRFDPPKLMFGTACSPLVEGGRVLVNVGANGASVVAFDAGSGEVAWKSLDDPASYSSPVVFGEGSDRQAVFLTGKAVTALDPATGKEFWRYPFEDKLFESSATPARAGGRLVVSAITLGSAGLDLRTEGDKPAVREAWKNPALTSYFTTPVAVGPDHVFMVTGKNPLAFRTPEATLHCVDMRTGRPTWSRPKVGKYHAALLRTGDGKVLLLEDGGGLALLAPDTAEYRELARATVCGPTWCHPGLSDGQLYLRDEKELVCVRLAAGGGE
jgi:outer membrane protein assembly factor BamB